MSSRSVSMIFAVIFAFLACVQAQWFGGWSQPSYGYNSAGLGVDSNANSFVGTPDNGIYLFCNGVGCPGRG